jgi:hypothetical protein
LVHYTGYIKVQGAANYESVWYNATDAVEYLDYSGPVYFNVLGYHPLLRVAFNNQYGYGAQGSVTVTDGVVTEINLSYAGSNYIAPPFVQILGDGTGAEAVATVSPDGQVSGVTIVSGGEGYWPIQLGSTVGATVVFSNGVVENIQYR